MIRIFAYGSNMDCAQMRERCPSARFLNVAKLPNHELAFTRRSTNRGCGVADAIPRDGKELWGVVYEIDEAELPELDRWEGVNSGAYVRRDAQSVYFRDEDEPIRTSIYFANPQHNPPLPNAK